MIKYFESLILDINKTRITGSGKNWLSESIYWLEWLGAESRPSDPQSVLPSHLPGNQNTFRSIYSVNPVFFWKDGEQIF